MRRIVVCQCSSSDLTHPTILRMAKFCQASFAPMGNFHVSSVAQIACQRSQGISGRHRQPELQSKHRPLESPSGFGMRMSSRFLFCQTHRRTEPWTGETWLEVKPQWIEVSGPRHPGLGDFGGEIGSYLQRPVATGYIWQDERGQLWGSAEVPITTIASGWMCLEDRFRSHTPPT